MRPSHILSACSKLCAFLLVLQFMLLKHHTGLTFVDSSSRVNSPPNANSNSRIQNGPRAILHIGPHKTGSTALQAFAYSNEEVFLKDNFVLPHLDDVFSQHKTVANLAVCLNRNRDPVPINCAEVFRNTTIFLNRARQNGQNVFFSSEEFSKAHVDIEHLAGLLNGFDIEVVLVYRRYHEYLRSLYFELHRHIERMYKEGGIKKVLSRPGLHEWVTPDILETWKAHFTVAALDRFESLGKVRVINWYEQGDLVANLLCSLSLPNTCAEARKRTFHARNAAYSFDPEFVLAEAHRRKLVDWGRLIRKSNYRSLRDRVAEFLKNEVFDAEDLQYECLSKTQEEQLVAASQELDREAESAIQGYKVEENYPFIASEFCNLNAANLFDRKQGVLVDFMQQLEER